VTEAVTRIAHKHVTHGVLAWRPFEGHTIVDHRQRQTGQISHACTAQFVSSSKPPLPFIAPWGTRSEGFLLEPNIPRGRGFKVGAGEFFKMGRGTIMGLGVLTPSPYWPLLTPIGPYSGFWVFKYSCMFVLIEGGGEVIFEGFEIKKKIEAGIQRLISLHRK